MLQDNPGPADVLDMCCGRKQCPKIEKNHDGSLVISDENAAPGVSIPFTPEQAQLLRDFLNKGAG